MASDGPAMNPELDLVLSRVVPVSRAFLWKGWTDPDTLKKWFCPRPWMTTDCTIDLRPGGEFSSLMQGPEGEAHANTGCFLEVVPETRLVWTDMMLAGFQPSDKPFLSFTATISFEDVEGGTRYSAHLRHRNAADRQKHAEMGFEQGWGAALDQLVALSQDS
jgi:uncharacterized protein YndB with AHSA1/START domain